MGYWLLTGTTLFDEEKVRAVLTHQMKSEPLTPSARAGRAVSADLESVIMRCLAKAPEERPKDAEALDDALANCVAAGAWTPGIAQNWWSANVVGIELPPVTTMAEKTLVIAQRDD